MYKERIEFYKMVEQQRDSKLLVYVTGDRRGLETQIHSEVLDLIVSHLDFIGVVPKISLYLYTKGGETLAAWSIANLLRQYCEEFEVLVPAKAHSAGTLICLGANTIIMTKQATLGPIDPSVNTPLNPSIDGAPANAPRIPVSVEAVNAFIELAKQTGIESSSDLAQIMIALSNHIHPLVLGQAYRTRSQIQMLGRRLLFKHMQDEEKVKKILSFLCSESGSHDYMIYPQEARDELGLNIEMPEEELYIVIKQIYDDIAKELILTEPFNSQTELGEQDTVDYAFTRALLESVNGGSHAFTSKGRLTKQNLVDQQTKIIHEGVLDRRISERWEYDKV